MSMNRTTILLTVLACCIAGTCSWNPDPVPTSQTSARPVAAPESTEFWSGPESEDLGTWQSVTIEHVESSSGEVPAYSVQINSTGVVRYRGGAHTRSVGDTELRIPEDTV